MIHQLSHKNTMPVRCRANVRQVKDQRALALEEECRPIENLGASVSSIVCVFQSGILDLAVIYEAEIFIAYHRQVSKIHSVVTASTIPHRISPWFSFLTACVRRALEYHQRELSSGRFLPDISGTSDHPFGCISPVWESSAIRRQLWLCA